MKSAKELLTQAIKDCEELAKSPLISPVSQNSKLQAINNHKALLQSNEVDEKLACECIEDLYSGANHLRKLYPELDQQRAT